MNDSEMEKVLFQIENLEMIISQSQALIDELKEIFSSELERGEFDG